MTLKRTPLTEQPEFDDVELIPVIDRILIWLLMPYVWVHGLVAGPSRLRRETAMPRIPELKPVTTDDILPEVAEKFFDTSERAGRAVGFREPRRFRLTERS